MPTRDYKKVRTDFLGRDDTFVKVREEGRIEWERMREEGTPYSAFLLKAPTKADLVKRAYPLATNMLTAMRLPHKVKVVLRNDEHSRTDYKRVFVSTKVFDEEELSTGDRLDVFLGYTIHEGCHILYTTERIRVGSMSKFEHSVYNVIEDERIEARCGDEKPGLVRFIAKTKYYLFDYRYKKTCESMYRYRELSLLQRFFNALVGMIRYPATMTDEEIDEFYDYLIKAKEILTPYPETTRGSIEAAHKIIELTKELYKDKEREERTPKPSDEDTSDSVDEGEGGEGGESTEEKSDESKEGSEEKKDGEGSDDTTESGEDLDFDKDSDDFGAGEDDEREDFGDPDGIIKIPVIGVSDEEIAAAAEDKWSADMAAVAYCLAALETDPTASDVSGVIDWKLSAECSEGLVEGVDKRAYFIRSESNEAKYKESLERVKPYISAVKKTIVGHCKEYKLTHRSMRSGVLDTNKLVEAVQGVPTVYIREGEVKTDKIAVVVLIDESGSMGFYTNVTGSDGKRLDRHEVARDAAVLIEEALKTIDKVELFIYGHTADIKEVGDTQLTMYREGKNSKKYALGSVYYKEQNRDGVAIYEVARRVRTLTDTPAVMLVISDGEPCARGYTGMSAINHTRQKVGEVERLGMQVIQICVDKTYDPALMFRNFVVLNDIGELPSAMGRMVRSAVLKLSKERIS